MYKLKFSNMNGFITTETVQQSINKVLMFPQVLVNTVVKFLCYKMCPNITNP